MSFYFMLNLCLLSHQGLAPYSQMDELAFYLENYGEIFAYYCATTLAN